MSWATNERKPSGHYGNYLPNVNSSLEPISNNQQEIKKAAEKKGNKKKGISTWLFKKQDKAEEFREQERDDMSLKKKQ